MGFPAFPVRQLTAEELKRYDEDGVIMVKGAIDKNWIEMIDEGVEQARRDPSVLGKFMSRKVQGYAMDIFMWKRIDVLRDLIYYGPFAHWAKAAMRAKEVRFFYDQIFVKEPGTDAPTPWHQDLTFWPIRGEQITSFWIPLNPVTAENSGLLYVRGSHKWPQRFKSLSPDYVAALIDEKADDIPDINANPDKYDLLHWDMEPGDFLMFHPLTLHGSFGNKSRTTPRRALALRWTGEDVVFEPGPKRTPIHFKHDSQPGGPLRGAAFPIILPHHDPEERAARVLPESAQPHKLVGSAINNAVSAVKLELSGKKSVIAPRQTWDDPSKVAPAANATKD